MVYIVGERVGLGIKDEQRHSRKECYVKASSQEEKKARNEEC
jgi:hypothetical protein